MKVSLAMLLKTNVEKMSVYWFATMLLKKRKLMIRCHDIYENKRVRISASAARTCFEGRWLFVLASTRGVRKAT
jgi:hypothetical protein